MSTGKLQAHSHSEIIQSAGIIGFSVFCSRILGFVRDIVIARLFGVYVYAQAFIIAFKIPNLFRDLLAEGAANAAFVPVFSEYALKHKKEEFWELASILLNLLLVILTAVTILGIWFCPAIIKAVAPGFTADADKLKTAVLLTRIIFPYILLVSLAAYATAILNTFKSFAVSSFGPCLLNISIIVFAFIFGEGIIGLSLGVLVGGAGQLAIQIPALYGKGFRLSCFLTRFRHPAAKDIGRLMLPRLFSSCVYQLNNFVDSFFGSLAFIVGEGGIAGLYFAYRLIQFPIGIFSNALSQAILPAFSAQILEDSQEKIKQTFSFGLRATFLAMLPASVAFMVLARPLVTILFKGGKFDAYSVDMTAGVLFFYSIGLFAYGSAKIMQTCFFAMKDTVTPAKVSFLALALNIILNSVLMFPMKLAGIALSTSLSGIITSLVLFFKLKKKLSPFDALPIVSSFLRILLASMAMGMVCYFLSSRISFSGGVIGKIGGVILLSGAGAGVYAFFCYVFGVKELRELWERLRNPPFSPKRSTGRF